MSDTLRLESIKTGDELVKTYDDGTTIPVRVVQVDLRNRQILAGTPRTVARWCDFDKVSDSLSLPS